jgi:hypothetical protein
MLLMVGAGVIVPESEVTGEGVTKVKPHSLEKVICWSHSDTVTLDASPFNVIAQTVVAVGT